MIGRIFSRVLPGLIRWAYFFVFDFVTASSLAPLFARFFGIRQKRLGAFLAPLSLPTGPAVGQAVGLTVAFHASSVGELEMLRPLMELAIQKGQRILVTAFSDSALDWLENLKKGREGQVSACLSPRESQWGRLFELHSVQSLWMAKYDFWPGLLWAANRGRLPIRVVNAHLRTSVRVLPRLASLFGLGDLRVVFHAATSSAFRELEAWCAQYPTRKFSVVQSMDPRRVQIQRRVQAVSARAQAVLDRLQCLPSPRVVVGSVWPGDLFHLQQVIRDTGVRPGSLILFPHSFESSNLENLRQIASRLDPSIRVEWVQEKGVLVECYQAADWIWVGGGFDAGVHSTLEPAYTGCFIGIGPKNSEKFEEIAELQHRGILTICANSDDLASWWKRCAERVESHHSSRSSPIHFPSEGEFFAHFEPFLAPS
jgi:3-deoxy-D-manno-octulosonic-acid transferase